MGTKDSVKSREARRKRNALAAEARAAEKAMTDQEKKEKKASDRFHANVARTEQRRQERKALVASANRQAQPIFDARFELGMLLREGSVVQTMLDHVSVVKAASEAVDPSLAAYVTVS